MKSFTVFCFHSLGWCWLALFFRCLHGNYQRKKEGKTREMARQTATTRPSRKKQPQQTNTRSERKEMIRLNISSCITMANECLQNCVIEKKLERERDKATQFVSFHLVFATISPPHVTFSSFFSGAFPIHARQFE